MKKITYSMLGLGILLGSCVHQTTPKDVAGKFLKALSENNYSQAKRYATHRTDKLLEAMRSVSSLAPQQAHKTYNIIGQSVQGDKAWIRYREGNNGQVETLNLVRKNDVWLVGAEE